MHCCLIEHSDASLQAGSLTSLFAIHCRKFVFPQPLAPMSPYLRPMVTSMLQSCMSSTPLRLMLNPLIFMSLEVGLDVRTPAGAHNICMRCFRMRE